MAEPPLKKVKTDNGAEGEHKDTGLSRFTKWCEDNNFQLNAKVNNV